MGLLDLLYGPDLEAGLQQWQDTPGALLVDVRTPEEYAAGHIPGSRNLPLDALQGIGALAPGRDTPLFLYCRSGARSGQAARMLQATGYTRVTNIGGILRYHGPLEH